MLSLPHTHRELEFSSCVEALRDRPLAASREVGAADDLIVFYEGQAKPTVEVSIHA